MRGIKDRLLALHMSHSHAIEFLMVRYDFQSTGEFVSVACLIVFAIDKFCTGVILGTKAAVMR